MGLLDDSMFEDSNRMANLQLGLGLLGASSQTGRGIADAFGGAINSHQQSQLMKRKKAHDDMVMQEQQMRMDDYRQGKADRLAQAQQMQQAQQLMNTMGNDYQGMIRAGIPAAMVKERADSMNYGREKVARTGEIAGADGSKMMQDFDAYGGKIGEGQRGYVAPVQINRGNRIDIVSPQSGQSFQMGQSPDSQATERNARLSRDQSEKHFNAGQTAPQYMETENGIVALPKKLGAGQSPVGIPVMGQDGQALKKKQNLPQYVVEGVAGNAKSLSVINSALAGLDTPEGKNATGWKGYLPNSILSRTNPEGVNTRADIADIGSLVLHDRSGAAVTAAESPRLMPFIPLATDDAATAKKKLTRFKQLVEADTNNLTFAYPGAKGLAEYTNKQPENAGSSSINSLLDKYK